MSGSWRAIAAPLAAGDPGFRRSAEPPRPGLLLSRRTNLELCYFQPTNPPPILLQTGREAGTRGFDSAITVKRSPVSRWANGETDPVRSGVVCAQEVARWL